VSVIVVGLNHRTAPVELRERVAVPASRMDKALHDLASREHLAEVVLLSTCNRTEIYARSTKFHSAVSDVLEFLGEQGGTPPEHFSEHLYTYYDDSAVSHLFGVAAGLDSEETIGQSLARVFKHAIEVGKRARTETAIGRSALSVSSAAVALAERTMFTLRGRSVLILGAGEVAEGLGRALVAAGAGDVAVANRTHARAVALAEKLGGRAVALGDLPDVLTTVDVLLTATDSTDVDPGVAEIPGVTLHDVDDLHQLTEAALDERRREVTTVREIIGEELERFQTERAAREVAPLVSSLRSRAEELRTGELDRFRAKLDGLDPEARNVVEALTQGIVNKLLHEPTVRLKEAAGTGRGELYSDALAFLFDIRDPEE
jgi:glutamyl-tRNA reductase